MSIPTGIPPKKVTPIIDPKMIPPIAEVFSFKYDDPFPATVTTNRPHKKDIIPFMLIKTFGLNVDILLEFSIIGSNSQTIKNTSPIFNRLSFKYLFKFSLLIKDKISTIIPPITIDLFFPIKDREIIPKSSILLINFTSPILYFILNYSNNIDKMYKNNIRVSKHFRKT